MRTCPEVHVTRKCCVLDDVFNVPLGIYDSEFSEFYDIPNGIFLVSLSLHCEFFSGTEKME